MSRPVKTSSWIDAAMLISGGLLALTAMITGSLLDERFRPWPSLNLFAFAGFILGAFALIGAILWAGERERKRNRKQAIPPGLLGQPVDGVHVHDPDVLKEENLWQPRQKLKPSPTEHFVRLPYLYVGLAILLYSAILIGKRLYNVASDCNMV